MLQKVKSPGNQFTGSPVLKEIALCTLSAVLLVLSFPSFNLEFISWFGFVPVFFALNNKSQKQAFFLFFITGIIFWCGIIYWLMHVTSAGAIVLVLYLALYFAVFGLIIRPCTKHSTPYALIFIPSVWVLLEYVRSHLFTGFPWALLGYSQYLNLPVIQVADITGVWGVSFLVMMVNVAITEILSYRLQATGYRQKIIRVLFFACVLLLASCGYGYYKLHSRQSTVDSRQIKISVIQGNIPQELKWDADAKDFIIDEYLKLTVSATHDKPDLIIWPESALPVILEEEPVYFMEVKDFVNKNNILLLLGAVRLEDKHYYNSALLVSEETKSITKYNKLHLVPFGEYIPLRKTLPFLETIVPIGDFTPGKEYTVFQIPNPLPDRQAGRSQITSKFSVLICFEDLFPELSREFRKRGADFLVNITNDAWFKKTSAPYQHLSASVFRAVENRVFLARAANTGISGFIAPSGKIISLVRDKNGKPIFTAGYDTQSMSVSKASLSFYSRFGDVFVILCILLMLYGSMRNFKSAKLKM